MSNGIDRLDGWTSVRLREIVDHVTIRVDPKEAGDVAFLGLEHVEAQTMKITKIGRAQDVKSTSFVFAEGDVLYSRLRPYLNKVAQPAFSGICSGEFIVMRPLETVDATFLRLVLNSAEFVEFAGTLDAGDRPRVKWGQVGDYQLLLPPREEQEAIVARVEAVDGELDEANADVADALVLVAQMELAQMGAAFESSETVTLDDVATIQSGITKGPAKSAETREVPYLSTANVQAGRLDLSLVKTIHATEQQMKKHALQAGDVLVVEGGDADKVGRGWIWRGEIEGCLHQNHVFAVRPKEGRLIPEFLAYFLNSPAARSFFGASAKQTVNLASIDQTQLKALPLPALSPEDQQVTINRLSVQMETVRELRSTLEVAQAEGDALRRAIRRSALAGDLTADLDLGAVPSIGV